MDWLIELTRTAHTLWAILAGITSFIVWKRVGFKAPMYLHVIAFASGCIGVLLAYMGHASGAEHGHKAIWLIVGFPVATYFVFGFFGGGHVMADRGQSHER